MSPAARAATRWRFAALVLIWSTSFMWIKIAVEAIGPLWLSVSRLGLGAVVIAVAAWRLNAARWPAREQWPVIVLSAVLGNALPYTLIHFGERTVDAGVAAVLMGTMPLATFALAWPLLGERLNARQLGGLFLGFAGLVCLVGVDALQGLGTAGGQLLVAAGAACYALSAVGVRRLGSTRSLTAVSATLWLSFALILPAAIALEPLPPPPTEPGIWFAVVMLGAFCTGAAAVLYFQLLGELPANSFAQINYIIPLLGYAWGLLFLGEVFSPRALLAAALILIGVRLVIGAGKARRPHAPR